MEQLSLKSKVSLLNNYLLAEYGVDVEKGGTGPDQRYHRLKAMQFWCGDQKAHLKKRDYHNRGCCLTHTVGLPKHGATQEEMPLTPYQVDFVNRVLGHKKPKRGQSPAAARKTPHLFHLTKGRQMGFTEIILRLIQYLCLHDYEKMKVGIVAATNGDLARKDLRRLDTLYENVPYLVEQRYQGRTVVLTNGTIIEAFPASDEALTGDTNYKCVFLDEAAKWRTLDDQPVFNSILPIVRNNGADLILCSTPKGPVKKFFEIYEHPGDFMKLEYDIWESEGNMHTKETIEEMIASSMEDPKQEYLCKFVLGRLTALGEITDENRQGLPEWGVD